MRGCASLWIAFCAVAGDTVLHDSSRWNPYRITVPYHLLAIPPGEHAHLILSFSAYAGGMVANLDVACIIPSYWPRSTIPEALNVPRQSLILGDMAIEPAIGPDGMLRFTVSVPVEAYGFRGQSFLGTVRMRTTDGRPIYAARDAHHSYVDAKGLFCATSSATVLYDGTKWASYRLSVPPTMLHLQPQGTYAVIFSFTASSGYFSGMTECEHVVFKP